MMPARERPNVRLWIEERGLRIVWIDGKETAVDGEGKVVEGLSPGYWTQLRKMRWERRRRKGLLKIHTRICPVCLREWTRHRKIGAACGDKSQGQTRPCVGRLMRRDHYRKAEWRPVRRAA